MWIFQNTFASTETQRHVKPLRMIDEVCFEMANIKQTRLKMEEKRYSEAGSVTSNTITEIQKEHIRACILKAIENGAYYPGLEERACQAISYINRFSDAQIKENLIDNKTGEVYMLVRP
nr:MAG TPA: hypothetical protein [Caudoviricetes sp.]